MEQRKSNIIVGCSGGTASKTSKTYKISLPNTWVEEMGLNEVERAVDISFDGEKIVIEKKKTPEEFLSSRCTKGNEIYKLKLYDGDILCTYIVADFTDKTICFENFTDIAIKKAFGNNQSPDWNDFEYFLKERCIPQSRMGLREYLNAIGVDSFDPIEIIKKTKGRMAEDNQWVDIERVK